MIFSHRTYLLFTALIGCTLVAASCDLQPSAKPEERTLITHDTEALSQRVTMINEPIGKGAEGSAAASRTSGYVHLADIRVPSVDGRELSATSVHLEGDYAYVTYHLHGAGYGGAIDIVDVSNADDPRIISHKKYRDTDLNDITVGGSGSYIYVTGGRKPASSGYGKTDHHGAVVTQIELRNHQLTATDRETPLRSYSGNAVEAAGNYLVVSTGGHGGGFYVLDTRSLSVVEGIEQDLARHIDIEGNTIAAMALNAGAGNTADLYKFGPGADDGQHINTKVTVTPVDGRNVIDLEQGRVYAALSEQGYRVYNFSQGSAPLAAFAMRAGGLANGLDAGPAYLYMAAGSEGLYIAQKDDLSPVFHWDSARGSANEVEADSRYIFVGKGSDGLNILKKES